MRGFLAPILLVWGALYFNSASAGSPARKSFHSLYGEAVNAVHSENYADALKFLEEAIDVDPDHVDALQLYGALCVKQGDYAQGIPHIKKAIELNNWKNGDVVSNYVHALRLSGRLQESVEVARRAVELFPNSGSVVTNSAYTFFDANDKTALILFDKLISMQPDNVAYWEGAIEAHLRFSMVEEAAQLAQRATRQLPRSSRLLYYVGHCAHIQNKISEALGIYRTVVEMNPEDTEAWVGIAGAYQEMGELDSAAEVYERMLNASLDDHAFLNNFGALLTNMGGRGEEGERYLQKALELRPNSLKALSNLGTYYHDEGNISMAREMFSRADKSFQTNNKGHNSLFGLRGSLLLPTVPASYQDMVDERKRLVRDVRAFISRSPPTGPKEHLEGILDRTVFYIQYHGFNDRLIQDLIAEAYRKNIVDFELINKMANPSLDVLADSTKNQALVTPKSERRIRVGFLSKFFGVFEPHALLLDGVMRYLPRSRFEVIAFPVSRSDGKPLAPGILEGADRVVPLSLNHVEAMSVVSAASLDVLVFADTQSEPMTHFMCHHRIAPIQIAFWGNPITSASQQVDFFVSSDDMEHPFRTHIKHSEEPYVEQVVLLDGQGIWYYHPDSPQLQIPAGNKYSHLQAVPISREDFGLGKDWFIFFCPQSVFKMHPLFDNVFADILRRIPSAHLVVTGGRRPTWTDNYLSRLERVLGPELSDRTHMIKRISSENFLNLLRIADVLLHPFPFDGSRTSADGIGVNVPVLTLPTEYLRGRMCHAFYRTMDLPELVAKNRSDYVHIAAKLALNRGFYNDVKRKISERSHLIWEDMEVPFMWSNFMTRIGGIPNVPWDRYLAESGRNVEVENNLREERDRNRKHFRQEWGEETWLLRPDAFAPMKRDPDGYEPPFIFSDWGTSEVGLSLGAASVISTADDAFILDNPRASIKSESDRSVSYIGKYQENILAVLKNRGPIPAAAAAEKLYRQFSRDSDYLLEMGSLEYIAGHHEAAFKYCSEATIVDPESAANHGCVGASAIVLKKEDIAIKALAKAWKLLRDSGSTVSESSSKVFGVTKDSLENSLLTALYMFKRYDECLDLVEEFLDLSPLTSGGAHAVLFSLVQWSQRSLYNYVNPLIERLQTTKEVEFSKESFVDMIHRIQQNHMSTLHSAYLCVTQATQDVDSGAVEKAYQDLWTIVRQAESATAPFSEVKSLVRSEKSLSAHDESPAISREVRKRQVILLTQFFNPAEQRSGSSTSSSENEEMAAAILNDIDRVLSINLNNPAIDKIVLFVDGDYNFAAMYGPVLASKIIPYKIDGRATFRDVFEYANKYIDNNHIVVLANSDIYFDESLYRLTNASTLFHKKTILALTKWETQNRQNTMLKLRLRVDSQDAWVFSTPVPNDVVQRSDFFVGQARCDNAIASLFHDAGYSVENRAFALRAIEMDTRGRPLSLYSNAGIDTDIISKWVLFSDDFTFQ